MVKRGREKGYLLANEGVQSLAFVRVRSYDICDVCNVCDVCDIF